MFATPVIPGLIYRVRGFGLSVCLAASNAADAICLALAAKGA